MDRIRNLQVISFAGTDPPITSYFGISEASLLCSGAYSPSLFTPLHSSYSLISRQILDLYSIHYYSLTKYTGFHSGCSSVKVMLPHHPVVSYSDYYIVPVVWGCSVLALKILLISSSLSCELNVNTEIW